MASIETIVNNKLEFKKEDELKDKFQIYHREVKRLRIKNTRLLVKSTYE